MNKHVHKELTRLWAEETGFARQDASTIAQWDWNVDVAWPGRPWRNKRFHHLLWGGPRMARRYFECAVKTRSLPHLGVALHIRQDVIGHGLVGSLVHWPAMDRWEERSEGVRERIESESRRMLGEYLEACGELPADGGAVAGVGERVAERAVLPLPEV